MSELDDRSTYLVDLFRRYEIPRDFTILEVGCGDGRNLHHLKNAGYPFVMGIDKEQGLAIEDVPSRKVDVIFTMSCLFLIPEENSWVFEKIANMAKQYIFTLEGETSKGNGVIGRDYGQIFTKFGFDQVEHQVDVFNPYGVMRVFKKHG